MQRLAVIVGLVVGAAGCTSSRIVSRQQRPPRLQTRPGSELVVAEYASDVPEVPQKSKLLTDARADLIRVFETSELFDTIHASPQAASARGACLLKPRLTRTFIEVDTGFWRNAFLCLTVVGLFVDLRANEIAAEDHFECDVLVRTDAGYSSVKKLLFETTTVYRYSPLVAFGATDWGAVQDYMFAVANQNFAIDLARELPRLLQAAAAQTAPTQDD